MLSCLMLLVTPITSQLALGQTKEQAADTSAAGNEEVAKIMKTFPGRGALKDESEPTPGKVAVTKFRMAEGLKIELVAEEPQITQPLYLNFDERGRLWVVQYRQYPFPAGLKIIRYDQHLRAVFDKVPTAPPNHVPGADRITVLEDLDADGTYETQRDVITGLNIATSAVADLHGIWVLNPPYLLYYPDVNGDAVPDGDPEVHLSGFGLEDTHSVANSLRWGPDGWLYAANGSTTTAKVRDRTGTSTEFQGQCIWRYHPKQGKFEIYAEGGGNTFSTEIDRQGRVFSGTNGGNTRGMYYPQGSYGEKNWGKHGPLTNPYSFGYFLHMRFEGDGDRFPQTFAIYEAGKLPSMYDGTIIAANALHNRVWASRLLTDTSSYRTIDLPPVLETDDRWFRPVDVKVGPDGAVYLADWYDSRLSHVDPRDDWHKGSGRIYRILASDGQAIRSEHPQTDAEVAAAKLIACATHFDLTKMSSKELLVLLGHENRFFRQAAVRVLGQRDDRSIEPVLIQLINAEPTGRALEALWVLNWWDRLDDAMLVSCLRHENEHVRRWAARLAGDRRAVSQNVAAVLAERATQEPVVQVRTQLASTAKRLPAEAALPIIARLVERAEDASDLHQPLLIWWALEAQCQANRSAIVDWLQSKEVWDHTLVKKYLLERLMQRFAMSGSAEDWQMCADLMRLAPSVDHQRLLVNGLREALAGRKVGELPKGLAEQLASYRANAKESDLPLRLRQGEPAAIAEALKLVVNTQADKATRIELTEILGEIKAANAVGALLRLLNEVASHSLQRVALQALANFDDPKIGSTICNQLQSTLPTEHDVQHTAFRVLASRVAWSHQLIDEIDQFRVRATSVPLDVVQQLRLHEDPALKVRVLKHWGNSRGSAQEVQTEVDRVKRLVKARAGSLENGQQLFKQKCGTCHTLFGEGGKTGPDLTGYERTNLEFLIPSILDPSAAIREEFTNFQILTVDGRVLTGLIEAQDTQTVTLRGVDNQSTKISRDDIDSLKALPQSLMPEALLKEYSEEQIQDLFAYLTARTPK